MNNESRGSRAVRFAQLFVSSRYENKKSQEFMATELGVSKKTIQNWEKGLSSPSFFQANEWFRVLGLNPIPYYLAFAFPDMKLDRQGSLNDQEVSDALHQNIDQLTDHERRQLLYLLTGRHGSSPNAVLNLVNAHLQTPLRCRLNTAATIVQNYEIEEQLGNLSGPNDIQPDIPLLKHALNESLSSIIQGNKGYTSVPDKNSDGTDEA